MRAFSFIFLICFQLSYGQSYELIKVQSDVEASFRSMSVVNDSMAWIGGSKGFVGKTFDGGKSWVFLTLEGYEDQQFRSIYAFDHLNAVVANAGSPGIVLYTEDGGKCWKEVYRNDNPAIFMDGIDFWDDNRGLIYGDAIAGRMLLLETKDGGKNWSMLPDQSRPELNDGEASFAASGTGIRCIPQSKTVMISTGGRTTRLWISGNYGRDLKPISSPMINDTSTTGIFSFTTSGDHLITVGGNFLQEDGRDRHVYFSRNGGKEWITPKQATRGYRESVEHIEAMEFVTIGPSGAEYTIDGGLTWQAFSDEKGFHVIRKSRIGNLILAAGGNGNVAIVKRIP